MGRYRTTIILVIVLVALAALTSYLQSQNLNATPSPTPEATIYVWQDTEPVTAIDVVSGTTTVSVRLDVSSTIWSLIAPVRETADPITVGNVATLLHSLEAMSVVTNTGSDLAQFGLGKDNMSVMVKAGPSKHHMTVGAATIDGSGYYVKTDESSNIYVVTNSTIEPIKSWLQTPPKVEPTATPLPITFEPSPSPTTAITITVTPILVEPSPSATP